MIDTQSTIELRTERLRLTPLSVDDAIDMVHVLADPMLYGFTGGEPPTLSTLRERYVAQTTGSEDPSETWYNWIVRLDGAAIGFVQATASGIEGAMEADLAWVIGIAWQGKGFATEAATAMRDWLASVGVGRFTAHIHPHHAISMAVARSLDLVPTEGVDEDGERIWSSQPVPKTGGTA